MGSNPTVCAIKETDKFRLVGFSVKSTLDEIVEKYVEIIEGWLFDDVVTVEGISVISLKGLLEMKKRLGRAKDTKDVELIEEALLKI